MQRGRQYISTLHRAEWSHGFQPSRRCVTGLVSLFAWCVVNIIHWKGKKVRLLFWKCFFMELCTCLLDWSRHKAHWLCMEYLLLALRASSWELESHQQHEYCYGSSYLDDTPPPQNLHIHCIKSPPPLLPHYPPWSRMRDSPKNFTSFMLSKFILFTRPCSWSRWKPRWKSGRPAHIKHTQSSLCHKINLLGCWVYVCKCNWKLFQ